MRQPRSNNLSLQIVVALTPKLVETHSGQKFGGQARTVSDGSFPRRNTLHWIAAMLRFIAAPAVEMGDPPSIRPGRSKSWSMSESKKASNFFKDMLYAFPYILRVGFCHPCRLPFQPTG
jgi:hypothetical protein